jgi:hypothetical protein
VSGSASKKSSSGRIEAVVKGVKGGKVDDRSRVRVK